METEKTQNVQKQIEVQERTVDEVDEDGDKKVFTFEEQQDEDSTSVSEIEVNTNAKDETTNTSQPANPSSSQPANVSSSQSANPISSQPINVESSSEKINEDITLPSMDILISKCVNTAVPYRMKTTDIKLLCSCMLKQLEPNLVEAMKRGFTRCRIPVNYKMHLPSPQIKAFNVRDLDAMRTMLRRLGYDVRIDRNNFIFKFKLTYT